MRTAKFPRSDHAGSCYKWRRCYTDVDEPPMRYSATWPGTDGSPSTVLHTCGSVIGKPIRDGHACAPMRRAGAGLGSGAGSGFPKKVAVNASVTASLFLLGVRPCEIGPGAVARAVPPVLPEKRKSTEPCACGAPPPELRVLCACADMAGKGARV